jgi:hypothetical protein
MSTRKVLNDLGMAHAAPMKGAQDLPAVFEITLTAKASLKAKNPRRSAFNPCSFLLRVSVSLR